MTTVALLPFPIPPGFDYGMFGSLLTLWTIRLALACYVACLAAWIAPLGSRWQPTIRIVWTLGCLLFIVHVGCAFHFHHHWSHTAAWQTTARRTEELLGIAAGNGIYASYSFLLLWIFDCLWLWRPATLRQADSPPIGLLASATPMPAASDLQPTPTWRLLVHGFLLFIAINGAIVFESGPTRWAGLAAVLALAGLGLRRQFGRGRQYNKCRSEYSPSPPGRGPG